MVDSRDSPTKFPFGGPSGFLSIDFGGNLSQLAAVTFETFAQQFAEAIDGLDPSPLTPETAYRELPEWDSLAVLCIISMVDLEYSVSLRADDFQAHPTLGDLHQFVESRAAAS